MDLPDTQYARSGDVYVAFQVFGSGPIDLVFVPGWISHLDLWWDNPLTSHWLNGLARFARVIMFDKRGTGLSDRIGSPPAMDQRMDDIRAVMEAAGSKQAALLGNSEGGSLAALFAATYPDLPRSMPGTGSARCVRPIHLLDGNPERARCFLHVCSGEMGLRRIHAKVFAVPER